MSEAKKQVIFVCSGNTCRSPMAETILRAMLAAHGRRDVTVTSCGIAPCEGAPMTGEAVAALAAFGYKARAHRAKLWRDAYAGPGKLAVAMTREIRDLLPAGNVLTLGELSDGREVPDPYGCGLSVYEAVCRQLIEMLTRFYRDVLAE